MNKCANKNANCLRSAFLYNAIMIHLAPGRSYAYAGEISVAVLAANNVSAVDFLPVDMAETGVKELRGVIAQASGRAFGVNRLLWLQNADVLSDVVQNTLLKIVEEPPPQLIVILQLADINSLLPTLRSRLHSVAGGEVVSPVTEPVIASSKAEAETTLRAAKDRPQLLALLVAELAWAKQQFLQQPSAQLAKRITLLSQSVDRLNQNCNQKLVIDAFLLHWFDSSGKA